jgi:hypothetical protein
MPIIVSLEHLNLVNKISTAELALMLEEKIASS